MNEWIAWVQNGWAQVVEHGLWTTLEGMLVVFAALTLITVFISILPRVLHFVSPLPHEEDTHSVPARKSAAAAEEDVVAAIAFALHTELQRKGR